MSPSCCCGVDCACCTGEVPSQLIIAISGVSGADNCCEVLNDSFVLTQDLVDGCLWTYSAAGVCTCGGTYDLEITAVMAVDGDDCELTVTAQVLDGATVLVEIMFHKVFVGGATDCCAWEGLAMDIESFTNEGTCDCAEDGLAMTVTSFCNPTCPGCDTPARPSYQVAISGVVNGSCGDCTNANGTHIVSFFQQVAGQFCEWRGPEVNTVCSVARFVQLVIFDDGKIRVNVRSASTILAWELAGSGAGTVDCAGLTDESIPDLDIGAGAFCDNTASSCLVTAL